MNPSTQVNSNWMPVPHRRAADYMRIYLSSCGSIGSRLLMATMGHSRKNLHRASPRFHRRITPVPVATDMPALIDEPHISSTDDAVPAPAGSAEASQVKRCYRTARRTQRCFICGRGDSQMHMPTGHIGHYCECCCPVCVCVVGAGDR
jgi:hypothetical protein